MTAIALSSWRLLRGQRIAWPAASGTASAIQYPPGRFRWARSAGTGGPASQRPMRWSGGPTVITPPDQPPERDSRTHSNLGFRQLLTKAFLLLVDLLGWIDLGEGMVVARRGGRVPPRLR